MPPLLSRDDCLNDGSLIDISHRAENVGIQYPVAISFLACTEYVVVPDVNEYDFLDHQRRLDQILIASQRILTSSKSSVREQLSLGKSFVANVGIQELLPDQADSILKVIIHDFENDGFAEVTILLPSENLNKEGGIAS